jgi:hypothetical protein
MGGLIVVLGGKPGMTGSKSGRTLRASSAFQGFLSFPFGAVQFGYIYFGDFVRGIGWQVLGAQ